MENRKSSMKVREASWRMAEKIVTWQQELPPEDRQPQRENESRSDSVCDVWYHLGFLAEALDAGDPTLFEEHIGWTRELFANLDVPDRVLAAMLECTRRAVVEETPPEAHGAALAILDRGLASLATAPLASPSHVGAKGPLGELARSYLDALLRGDRRAAGEMILAAVDEGVGLRDIYLQVFQPCQHELGRLWQTHRISVAQEHFCTAATQSVMSQLYPRLFAGERSGKRIALACVGGELHEIGARMVADFFELEGWDSRFYGANTPVQGIVDALREHPVDVMAISVTMTFHVNSVREIIDAVRANPKLASTPVLVGGYPFNIAPGLWQHVGADGFARDAESAVLEAERLVSR